jgi:hypothetical protein
MILKAISDTLIHFLGKEFKNDPAKQVEIFKSIINNGLKLSSIDTPFGLIGQVFNASVCFTDIPLNFCEEHTSVYGKFGIGFKKSFIKTVGGNPVRYFIDYSPILDPSISRIESRGCLYIHLVNLLQAVIKLRQNLQNEMLSTIDLKDGSTLYSKEQIESFCNGILYILSLEKPTGDLGPARDDTDSTDEYYKEREWRIVSSKIGVEGGIIVEREKEYYVPFKRNDIRLIIVPSDSVRKHITMWFIEESSSNPIFKEYEGNIPPIIEYDELKYF